MDEETEYVYPSDHTLNIGFEGLSQVRFAPQLDKRILAVGTCGGRVRIFDASGEDLEEKFRKKWHKSIFCLEFWPNSPEYLISASRESAIKVHNIETGQKTWSSLDAHDGIPITAMIAVEDGRWITGDEEGIINFWDGRQSNKPAFSIDPQIGEDVDDLSMELLTVNDLAIGNDRHGYLLAARDDGALVTYNIRRRRLEFTSDTMSYSARSLELVKDGKKVLVGTDEGTINVFNWNEFGCMNDRFSVRKVRAEVTSAACSSKPGEVGGGAPSIENIAKLSENVVAVATDDGVISIVHILPNQVIQSLGQHKLEEETNGQIQVAAGGDCLCLSVSPDKQVLCSAQPASNTVRFYPVQDIPSMAEEQAEKITQSKKECKLFAKKSKAIKRQRVIIDAQAKHARDDFLSGLCVPAATETSDPDEDSDGSASDASSDSDSSD